MSYIGKTVASASMSKVIRQVFTSSGTYTPSAGLLYADIEVCGGGGAGGGSATTGLLSAAVSGGGGGGEYARGIFTGIQIGSSQSITVGTAGVVSSGSNGGTGGTTSVGSLITALGGSGGIGGLSVIGLGTAVGGSGGTGGAGGSIRMPGQSGFPGLIQVLTSGISASGSGGESFLAPGAPGILIAGVGRTATGYGAGGGGSLLGASSVANAGGAGFKGVVIITEYTA